METILTKEFKPQGTSIEVKPGTVLSKDNLAQICDFYHIPATLINVDNKFGTHTLFDVVTTSVPSVQFMEYEGGLQVLDPKSTFVSDNDFNDIVSMAADRFKIDALETKSGLTRVAKFNLPASNNDSFLGDVYSKNLSITRMPEGGITIFGGILRLVCSNGAAIADKQYYSKIRSGVVDSSMLFAFSDGIINFDVASYLEALFVEDGVPLNASVADYMGMRKTLRDITVDGDGISDVLFPMSPIVDFYLNQGIEVEKISQNILNRIPSGLTYYQCYNILTNGAKSAVPTLKNQIDVANWSRPSKISQLKQASKIQFEGMPAFSADSISYRMGDHS